MFLNPVIGNNEIITSCGNDLKVYSLNTGECLRSLRGHERRITCTQLVPGNRMQVVSSSPVENALIWWDYIDGVSLTKKKLLDNDGEKIVKFAVLNSERVYAQVVPRDETSVNPKLWRVVELENREDNEYFVQTRTIRKTRGYSLSGLITGGKDGRYLVITSGRLLVWYDTKTRDVMKRGTREIITSCALHPTQDCVATGESNGQISLWRRNTCSTLHWHAHAVSTMSFTIDGTYLLSGGEEAVLVLWQLGTQKNTFIARLGAPIEAIATSIDATRYAVATKNNAIWVIDARSMQKDFRIRGLATQIIEEKKWLRKLVYDPRTRSVVVKADSGTLQFYDIFKDRHVFTLDVTGRNFVSKTEDEEHETWALDMVAVQGRRLSTLEKRNTQMLLKFWSWGQNKFELNTIVNQPHAKRVNTMSFNPSGTLLVTTSMDKTFKIWEIKPDSEKEQWHCRSVAFYQNEPFRDAKFSQDGSIIAAVCERTATFWNPFTNSLLDRLTHPCVEDRISKVELFSEYLFGTLVKHKKLYVWDLLRKSVLWTINGTFLDITSYKQYFIVAEEKNILIFFNTEQTPQTCIRINQRPKGIAFCPIRHVPIYSVSSGEILAAYEEETLGEISDDDEKAFIKETDASRFSGLLGNLNESRKRKYSKDEDDAVLGSDVKSLAVARSREVLKTLSTYSSHVLPPMSKLFDAFFQEKGVSADESLGNEKANSATKTTSTSKSLNESKALAAEWTSVNKEEIVPLSESHLVEEKEITNKRLGKLFKTLY